MIHNRYIKAKPDDLILIFPYEAGQQVSDYILYNNTGEIKSIDATGLNNVVVKKNNNVVSFPFIVDVGDHITIDFDITPNTGQIVLSGRYIDYSSSFVLKVNSGSDSKYTILGGTGYNYNIVTTDGHRYSNLTNDQTINFSSANTDYVIRINGYYPRHLTDTASRPKALEVMQWGNSEWVNFQNGFYGCSNLKITALDTPNLTQCKILDSMFRSCTNLTGVNNLENWDVRNVTSFRYMFLSCTSLVADLSGWQLISAYNTSYMFYNCTSFNINLNSWNNYIANITDMSYMFYNCIGYYQDIIWDNSTSVTNLRGFIYNIRSTNIELDAGNVTTVDSNSFRSNTVMSLLLKDMSVSFYLSHAPNVTANNIELLADQYVSDLTGQPSANVTVSQTQYNYIDTSYWTDKNWNVVV